MIENFVDNIILLIKNGFGLTIFLFGLSFVLFGWAMFGLISALVKFR